MSYRELLSWLQTVLGMVRGMVFGFVVLVVACSETPLGLDKAVAVDASEVVSMDAQTSFPQVDLMVESGSSINDASAPNGATKADSSNGTFVDASDATAMIDAGPDSAPDSVADADADSADIDADRQDPSDWPGSRDGSGPCQPVRCGTHSWACWPVANVAAGRPPHFTDLGDGIFRDDTTCLLWQTMPASLGYTWSDAMLRCVNNPLVGGTGWRLPTRIEMISVMDYSRRGPAVTPLAKGVLLSPPYWTSSRFSAIAGSAYLVSLNEGLVSYADESGQYLAWCVRGNGEDQDLPITAPPDHYTIRIDEVVDNYTGLVWERGDSQGLSLGGIGAEQAADYCKALALGGAAWRLPNVQELATLIDETRLGKAVPAIDAMAFPTTLETHYWTSTKYASSTWTVDFQAGLTAHDRTFAQTRCVH